MFPLGNVRCSWKTRPGTAREGNGYIPNAGTISFAAGVVSTSIDLSIEDNDEPELNKTFFVELYDAKEGGNVNRIIV